jgi:hypothetical protein
LKSAQAEISGRDGELHTSDRLVSFILQTSESECKITDRKSAGGDAIVYFAEISFLVEAAAALVLVPW